MYTIKYLRYLCTLIPSKPQSNMNGFIHRCPHCNTELSIKELSVEKTAAKCPSCGKFILLKEYGATVEKPTVYRCPICKKEHIYDGRPEYVHCDGCNNVFLTSQNGECLIDLALYAKGEKGELPFVKKRDRVVEAKNRWRKLPIQRKAGICISLLAVIGIAIGLYIWSLPAAIETTMAYADMDNVWAEFRAKNPYNVQIEGLKRYDDGSYVAIISEPNEEVTEEQLRRFFSKYNCSFKTFKQRIGYDGWLRDAVVSFNDLDENDVEDFSRKLSLLLYATDYKAGLIDFSTIPGHTAFSSYDLNYQVTEEELRKWFIEDSEALVSIDDPTSETTLTNLLTTNAVDYGLYMSSHPGFVVWLMDIGEYDLTEFKMAARKFSLDSDLILGAIATDDKVAIIARERCVPIYELPPMRQETLRLLASTSEDELAQSYERTTMFAGKLPGGKDYAPIYLSDELWHTEYGSTLNVTDQMLKSWSENGMIDYVDFNYPKPVDWAFEIGAAEDLGVSQLTYNWNTAGVGYIVEDEDFKIYALNRTGSLPVSYIPGDSEGISDSDPVYQAEQKAYDFFSYLSSPELVKVVQYAAMYQIFRNIGVTVLAKDNSEYADNVMEVPEELKTAANKTIKSLANLDIDDKKAIAAKYGVEIMTEAEYNAQSSKNGFHIDDSHMLAASLDSIDVFFSLLACKSYITTIESIHSALRPLRNDHMLMDCLGAYFLDSRGTDLSYSTEAKEKYEGLSGIVGQIDISKFINGGSSTTSTSPTHKKKDYEEAIWDAITAVQSNSFEIQYYNFIVGDLDVVQSRDLYLSINQEKCHTWMKCPTIVESWQLVDSAAAVGGHNLNSKVTSFRVSKDLKPGQTRTVEVGGKKIIEVSPQDRLSHISDPNYLRRVGRLGNSEIRGKGIATRARSEVVGIAERRSARGYNAADHMTVELNQRAGHTLNGKKYTDLTELLNDIGTTFNEGGNAQFKQIEIKGLKGAGVDVDVVIDGVVGRMYKGSSANLPLAKYDFAHRTVTYEGDKAIVTIPIRAGEIEFGSTSQVTKAGLGGSSELKPKIKIKEGYAIFKISKEKLAEFLNFIDNYLAKQKGYINSFKQKLEMRRRGLSPADFEESTELRIARNNAVGNQINCYADVWTVQEETIA